MEDKWRVCVCGGGLLVLLRGDLCSGFRAEGKKTIMVPGDGDICQQILRLNFLTNFVHESIHHRVFIPQQTG